MKSYLNHDIDLKVKQAHNVYIEEVNKIAQSGNDDKKLQTPSRKNLIKLLTRLYHIHMVQVLEKYLKKNC